MTDNVCPPDSLQENDKHLLITEQGGIAAELNAKRDVSPLVYNPIATRIMVPNIKKYPGFTLSLKKGECYYKKLIFGALNAAYYRYFMTEEFTDNRKRRFRFAKHLWDFLDNYTITKANRTLIFRDFESWRVKEVGVKTQSSGLKWVNLFLLDALELDEFATTIAQPDIDYLHMLTATRPAHPDEIDAVNLNNWFTQHTWLRRDDIGIGDELYTRLSSPRFLMKSFRITVENTLLHIQACKDALLDFFRDSQLSPRALPLVKSYDPSSESRSAFQIRVHKSKEVMFSALCNALSKLNEQPAQLDSALELIVLSHCSRNYRDDTLERLKSMCSLSYSIKKQGGTVMRYNSFLNGGLFDCNFLHALALAAQKTLKDQSIIPVCPAEKLLFSWLMAYQTVQASDIPKLRLSDFKFVRRANGYVTHIECEYWKGRANSIHQVATLPTKDSMGSAVIRYLKDVTSLTDRNVSLTGPYNNQKIGQGAMVGRLMELCQSTTLNNRLTRKHQEQRVAPVFLSAMIKLIHNGSSNCSKQVRCDTYRASKLFGLSLIKTSSVYAKTITFDPTTLLNLNSHTDNTERLNYLGKNNEDWQNRCGRITRAVMSDIAINVLRASNVEKASFESEFMNTVEAIKQRSNDTLSRMKMITEKASGRVDELGLYVVTQSDNSELPDALFLEDSPETVLKLTHYLAELERKHKELLKYAPEFLLSTALPTAEWIECIFDNKKFSNENLKQGQALYRRYANILPSHFTAQIT